ncbi:hypothetical protein HK102_009987 [Quaeritorhiza haematococci]|nr:hypothetical protein HK102_009987 [Quaeritorhiza haematococci]
MNFKTLYDTIATKAVEANTRFSQGYEEESLKLLEEVAKTIALIQDFKAKWTFLPKRGRPPKIDRPFKIARMDDVICVSGEARLMFNEPPVPAACPPAHIIQTIPVMDAPPSLSLDLNDESDDEEEAWAANAQMVLDPDLARRLDEVFFGFLARICSDLDAVDATGEKIMEYGNPATNDLTIFFVSDFPGTRHHTLLARKLSKVAESEGFHPFKFRIRSFSNAFRDELNKAGYTPAVMDNKKAKFYLWHQRYIARYNEDGKLAKSKGTNVWVVEGKKTADGGWIFKEFERKIILPYPMPTAYIGRRWSIEPKVYDPQVKGEFNRTRTM